MTATLTPARVAEMAAKATPGPWVSRTKSTGHVFTDGECPATGVVLICEVGAYSDKALLPFNTARWDADRAFIAAAPDMAALIAKQAEEIERLREALVAILQTLHQANPTNPKQWHVKPGCHDAFSTAVSVAVTALEAKP